MAPQPAKKTLPAIKPKTHPVKAQPAKPKAQARLAFWERDEKLAAEQVKLEKYQEALVSYDRAIAAAQGVFSSPELTPDSGRAMVALYQLYTQKGKACLKLKKNDEAVSAYEKAAEFTANKSAAYFNICSALYGMGRMERAKTACGRALAVDPSGPHAAEAKEMLNKTAEGK